MKRLSIIITNYNKGDRVILLLQHLENQTQYRSDIEIIIVDDCSKDGSREKIESFIEGKDIFKLHKNEQNLGPGLSRNRGLDLCTGEWITFIDGDDDIMDTYISTLSNVMNQTDADLICFDYETVNCISDDKVEYGLNMMLWTKLFRANIFYENNIRIDEDKFRGLVFGEDVELLYLYMCKTDKYEKRKEKTIKYSWGIGICNFLPDRYESSIPDGWVEEHKWLFTFNQSNTVIDFFITSHCNRNCSNCIAMIPMYKPCDRKHSDLESIKTRLEHILPYVDTISILGGETFLHPDLIDIIKAVKDSGVFSIYVYTNGSIEPDNLQDIIDIMDSRFTISISRYPDATIFDYTKYKMPYGVKWRITDNEWFDCGKLEQNDLPKNCEECIPKTFLSKGDKIYLCHRFGMIDQLGISKLQDNEWCTLEDFKTFKDTFNQGFTESCKYCLIGTDKCKSVKAGS